MHSLIWRVVVLSSLVFVGSASLRAQSAGSINGIVSDPSGAVVSGASVLIENPLSKYSKQTQTDASGRYQFTNLPVNTYRVTVSAPGFSVSSQNVDVQSNVPIALKETLKITSESSEVTVEASATLEVDPSFHSDVDRGLFDKLPLESQSSSLTSLVTLASPGVAADSNGLFHGMGDHASVTFSVDGQAISDQQSKVFSNQLPLNSVQSIQVYDGAPPAEFGDKTSVVISVTTRSGQNVTKPTGSITASYGTFGSSTLSGDLSYGGKNWGNFIELDGLNTGRFLDPPEFKVFHSKGNEFNFFDRIDRQINEANSLHLNLNLTRSWFQNPNTYDNLDVQNVVGAGSTAAPTFAGVGDTDQRSKIVTFNIAPTYTSVLSAASVFNFGVFVRHDGYNYYPSNNPLADLGPIQNESISQARSLLNTGLHTDFSYIKGINNIKVGMLYQQTFLDERDSIGIVNAMTNAPCLDASGKAVPGFTSPTQCSPAGRVSNAGAFSTVLLPYDLTRGGSLYQFLGHADIKGLALYAQDQIKAGNFVFNVGVRGDLYNGLAIARQVEPRLGFSYSLKPTHTVLRASYARSLETPYNENLVLSSIGCGSAVLSPLLNCTPGASTTLQPGTRNEYHAGLQQSLGKNFVVSGDYIWKYTTNAFDFSNLGNTPIFFPIDWSKSKTPGIAARADMPGIHGVSAFVVMSSVAARFFPPRTAGAGATVGQSGFPFRIDHDEKFNETTHLQYQFHDKRAPWVSFNWRFESGLNASATPCFNLAGANSHCTAGSLLINGQPAIDLSGFTADQEFEAGLACNGVAATRFVALPSTCLASQLTSTLLSIPAINSENDDRNPSRIQPRNVFDLAIGHDNIFNTDKHRVGLHLTAVNLTNKVALYNFLSTFSGTHYLTPRTLTAELAYHF